MECPKCKKDFDEKEGICPHCGLNYAQNKKIALFSLIAIIGFFVFQLASCTSKFVDEVEADKAKNQVTQEDIQQADDYIVTLEAAGLIEKIQNKCTDGSQGCYRLLINEYLWNNVTELHVKESLITASDIYFNSKKPYKHFEGVGSKSGKVLFNMWGIKN